ncbi:NUDIX hydrolase [Candidatus Kaiserbacteria bacterium]|nr:NUDIX hydrolase [Candidatus Kaiserbacteria bacterium]
MFPRHIKFAALAVDVAALSFIDGALNVRLVTTQVPVFKGKRALPGALIRPHETAHEAAVRVLEEKAGVSVKYLEQVCTFSTINRDPRGRVVSVAYMALLSPDELRAVKAREMHGAAWVPLSRIPHLAYDHDEIIQTTAARLRGKIEYTDIIRHLLPQAFTLTELQEACETILEHPLDKRNFRKKLLAQGIVKQTGKSAHASAHRPAALYMFTASRKGAVDLI